MIIGGNLYHESKEYTKSTGQKIRGILMGRRIDDINYREEKKVKGQWPKETGFLRKIGGKWCWQCSICGKTYIIGKKTDGSYQCEKCGPISTTFWLVMNGEPV
jgi:hypothetical protein